MKKNNIKAFALVETLVVASFVAAIFITLFINLYPIMGELEKRENYDDIDSVYKTYLIKKMIESDTNAYTLLYSNSNKPIECYQFGSNSSYCSDLVMELNVDYIYVSDYENNYAVITNATNKGIRDYLNSFDVTKNENNCNKRIIVQYKLPVNDEVDNKENYHYSSMGVDCHV